MTSMMNIKYMTSMKYMKWLVYFRTYTECKRYVIVYFFLLHIIIIFSYLRNEGYCNDSTVITT